MIYPPDFETFWNVYPAKRGGKIAAFKAFVRAMSCCQVASAEIIRGAQRYRDHCVREETPLKYIAHATTFLNQGRWEDEYDSPNVPSISPRESQHKARLAAYRRHGTWLDEWGPCPVVDNTNVVALKTG